MTMRAVLYARVSTGDQAKKGKIDPTEGSCETQFQNCQEIAKRLGATVIGEYKDEGISGDANDRPGYQAVLAAANQATARLSSPTKFHAYGATRLKRGAAWSRCSTEEFAFTRATATTVKIQPPSTCWPSYR